MRQRKSGPGDPGVNPAASQRRPPALPQPVVASASRRGQSSQAGVEQKNFHGCDTECATSIASCLHFWNEDGDTLIAAYASRVAPVVATVPLLFPAAADGLGMRRDRLRDAGLPDQICGTVCPCGKMPIEYFSLARWASKSVGDVPPALIRRSISSFTLYLLSAEHLAPNMIPFSACWSNGRIVFAACASRIRLSCS